MGIKISRQGICMGGKLGIRTRVARPGFRWPAAALAVAFAFVGPAGAVASAATAPRAAVTCTDNWTGPASGTSNWATAGDWSAGVPNGNSVACIKKAGTYTVQITTAGDAAAAVVVGGAASGTQTLQIDGVNFPITQPSEVLKRGVLSLTPTSSAAAAISATGTTVSLTIAAGGTLSSAGASNAAEISTPLLVNKGKVTLAAASNEDDAGTTTDKGSFTVASGSTFTSSSTDFTHSSGKLAVHGTFVSENTFTQSGGTETGHPVVQRAGTFVDSAGTGSFIAYQATIEGTIPAGQTLTNLASPGNSNDTIGTASAGVTVDGTLTCKTTSSTICSFSTNGNWPGITVASGGTLSTTGPGNASQDVLVNLNANMDVKAGGTLTIANPATMVNTYTLTNSGTWQVTATGYITIGGNCAVDSTGTIGVTVGSPTAPDGTIATTNISGFTATGTLAVHTVSSEVEEVIITRSGLSAAFSKLSFTPPTDTYTVTYPGGTAVELTPA
jgi:hypothetical protein